MKYIHPPLRHFRNILTRLSIKQRIVFAIILVLLITFPSIVLSLLYFSKILSQITLITDQDAMIEKYANDASIIMLEIRRDERNFIMFGNISEKESVEKNIAAADSIIQEISSISPESMDRITSDIRENLNLYREYFRLLADKISIDPPETTIERRKKISERVLVFQNSFENIMKKMKKAAPALRDSLLGEANREIDGFTGEMLTFSLTGSSPGMVIDNLEKTRRSFIENANIISRKSMENMEIHKKESMKIEARAYRNIISVLFVTGFLLIIIIITLPRSIVRPIRALKKIIQQTKGGNFSIFAPILTNDEVGELSASYNQMLERLRTHDELKTKKISSQKRAFDRVIEYVNYPICILSRRLTAIYYNAAFGAVFGVTLPAKTPEGGLELSEMKAFNVFFDLVQRKVLESTNEFQLETTSHDGSIITFRGRIVRNPLMELETIVLVGKSAVKDEGES